VTALKVLDREWWTRQDQVELWEAVMASFRLDPRPYRGGVVTKITFTSQHDPDVGKFDARLREAESHLGYALKAVKIVESEDRRTYHSRVRRADFDVWANGRFHHPIRYVDPTNDPAGAGDTDELHPRRLKSLMTVIAAMATKTDIEQPYGAAPSLVAKAKEIGLEISDRTVAGILEDVRKLIQPPKKRA
jgi:hypothetical protein